MKKKSEIWGFDLEPWLKTAMGAKASGKSAVAYVNFAKKPTIPKQYEAKLKSWHKKSWSKKINVLQAYELEDGLFFVVAPLLGTAEVELDSQLIGSSRARCRDAMGALLQACERADVESLEVHFDSASGEYIDAGLLGLEMASYKYKRTRKGEALKMALTLRVKGKILPAKAVAGPGCLGVAVNLARHLTNLPPNELNPETYAHAVKNIFSGTAVQVEVWNEAQLRKENCNLHLAVGQGSPTPPALVCMKYRPKGHTKSHGKPVAVVGKGITFDTGGVDIKPSSGMRLMKKDMGGSAAVVGLFYWAAHFGKTALDGYLALAENSVGSKAFRPSDVVMARSGQSVEIHNTDAEGRLVLADAMDVAVTRKGAGEPRAVIDIATLTGAIKGALGASLAGLFSNNEKLAKDMQRAGQDAGDMVWQMPLYQKYRSQLNSNFADVVNCSDGFGGAITAALFLETYAQKIPWAHLDIYAWKDSHEGAWSESGGSGQGVQLLARYLA